MKYKTTKKEIMRYYTVICVGYARLQYLMHYESAAAYTCGKYGWNSDIYIIAPGVALCTGYRPFGDICPDYRTVEKYEKRALDIVNVTRWNEPQIAKKELETLQVEFVKEVLHND